MDGSFQHKLWPALAELVKIYNHNLSPDHEFYSEAEPEKLPSYSPELNPVENLWHYFRNHYWANHTYADYDDLCGAAIDAWQKDALDPEVIKSVCRVKYVERKS
ncbi:MAG: transposase [Planctomycetota bacterium]